MGDRIAAIDAVARAATAYRHREQRGSALSCATRAQKLAEQCGGASTPALRAAAEPLPLTHREREIATLLGEGLSVRKVAERLTVSVRTVEGHIYRAMTKTGASTRDELVRLVHPRR
jgi:DNA-binding NarL/FixJ family response regulator